MKDAINVQPVIIEAPPSGGFAPGDLYYIFFRHKWKILLIFLAALAAGAGYLFFSPPLYQSEAKILIRFILENKSLTPENSDAQVKSPDTYGANIINSEIEILTSLDLIGQVVETVGPEIILARLGGGTNRAAAAAAIRNNIEVKVPPRSNILRILFRHPDPAVVQPVLRRLVDSYLKRHFEIHQGVGVKDDFFSRQADQLRARLAQTELDLKKIKTDAQIISLEDTKRACIEQISRIQNELLSAEVELAGRRTAFESVQKLLPARPALPPGEPSAPTVSPTPAALEEYRVVSAELDALLRRQAEWRSRYTEEHPLFKSLLEQIAGVEARKQLLEKESPALVAIAPAVPSAVPAARAEFAPLTEATRVDELEARVKMLTAQLDKVRADATRVVEAEPSITQLQRKKDLEETSYRYYSSSLEQARVDESIGASKITNIGVVQTPSPPALDLRSLQKPLLLILAVGCFGGFAFAFVTERFLNRTLKRGTDVERHLRTPLFLSIPDTSWRGGVRRARSGRSKSKAGAETPAVSGAGSAPPAARVEVAPWDPQQKLRAYFEGLRDRLITHFEVRNVTRRPKLVAITSCSHGAGVTTLAAGLAASLSETGEGNVLLVDMNLERGAARQFCKGRPECGLSEAFETATRDTALVQENFYLVSAHETNAQKLPRVLPNRFANLVPKMKASDYDYIIFDMPPATQLSVTPRLAGFMDMVLLVIESEKTGQEIAGRVNVLLKESGAANVAAVLNKQREYLPHRLSQKF